MCCSCGVGLWCDGLCLGFGFVGYEWGRVLELCVFGGEVEFLEFVVEFGELWFDFIVVDVVVIDLGRGLEVFNVVWECWEL